MNFSQRRGYKPKHVSSLKVPKYPAYDDNFSLGAFCESPGEEWDGQACDSVHSTCGGTVQDCHGRYAWGYFRGVWWLISFSGPGFRISDFESNQIIAGLQFQGAQKIMNGQLSPVSGAVKSVHAYMNMFVYIVRLLQASFTDNDLQINL